MIRVERLYKSFERPVLRGIELVVPDGAIVGVIGPAGGGKSLLLRALAGLVEPDAGSILIGGREMVGSSYTDRLNLQARLGMAFQNIALFEHLNVYDNIAFPLLRRGITDAAEVSSRVSAALETVGLGGFEKRPVQGLSGGQKRRVGLARAAIHRPSYLLYDEPAAGLDPVTTSRIFALLRRQQESIGATIVVISSDVERLLPVVDKLVVIHEGLTVFSGRPSEAARAKNAFVREFLGGDGPSVEPTKIVLASYDTHPPATFDPRAPSAPASLQGAGLLARVLNRPGVLNRPFDSSRTDRPNPRPAEAPPPPSYNASPSEPPNTERSLGQSTPPNKKADGDPSS